MMSNSFTLWLLCSLLSVMKASCQGKRDLAYFMLNEKDIQSNNFTERFSNYSLFVAPLSLSADDINKVHTLLPHAKVIGYYGFSYIVVGGCSPNCTFTPDRCNQTLWPGEQYFNKAWALTDLNTNLPICVEPWYPPQQRRPWNQMIPMKESVDAVVAYMKNIEFANKKWDGIYMDDFFSMYPPEWKAHITTVTTLFDIDGDGIADSFDKLNAQWMAWRPYLTAQMRNAIGDDKLFIANTGVPHIADAALNGITIEDEWTRCGGPPCGDNETGVPNLPPGVPSPHIQAVKTAYAGQGAVTLLANRTQQSVMWLTHPNYVPEATQCAEFAKLKEEMPWLVEGVDSAHVVCP
eukprot:m.164796 g.164796  ORF g.164796 m.164796 type:complete len:349 (+) comp15247_c2_seq1:192-1238(+)